MAMILFQGFSEIKCRTFIRIGGLLFLRRWKSVFVGKLCETESSSMADPRLTTNKKRAPLCNITNKTKARCSHQHNLFASSTVSPLQQIAVPSPSKSDDASVSMDETMTTCDSFKNPQVEYIDND